jgi:hypothetical protein
VFLRSPSTLKVTRSMTVRLSPSIQSPSARWDTSDVTLSQHFYRADLPGFTMIRVDFFR